MISDSLNKHLKTGILLFQHSAYLSFKPLNHLNENLSPCFSSFPKLQTSINEHSKSWDFFCYNHSHKCLSQSKHSLFTEQMNESPNTHLLCSKNHASYMATCKPHTHVFLYMYKVSLQPWKLGIIILIYKKERAMWRLIQNEYHTNAQQTHEMMLNIAHY